MPPAPEMGPDPGSSGDCSHDEGYACPGETLAHPGIGRPIGSVKQDRHKSDQHDDAKQAFASTMQALDVQGRPDEAIELTELCELGARDNVDANVQWRATRARALASRARGEEAERLACEAVAIAGETTSADARYVDTRNLFRWAWLQRGHKSAEKKDKPE